MLKDRIPQVQKIPQYRSSKLKIPKYRMKNGPIPQYRNTANPNVPVITRRNRQQAIYQSLKAIVSIKANKKAGFFI